MRRSLWVDEIPRDFSDSWINLKNTLLSLDDGWQVWTDWYDEIVCGGNHPGSRPLIEDLEVARVLVPDADWDKGPAHVNALIAELEAQYRAEAPAQRPAIIEVEVGDDGRLHRIPSRPPVARDDAQAQRLRSAWAAHADQLSALESLDPGRNSPGLGRALADYRHALGPAYAELDVIALGVHGTRIEGHAARADERLMDDAAGELVALAASHALFIRQFAAWREYLEDAADEPSDEVMRAALEFARSAAAQTEIVAEDVAEPLVALAELARPPLAAEPEDRPTPTVKRELLRSEGNILSGLLGSLMDYARDTGTEARKKSIEGSGRVAHILPIALALAGADYVQTLIAGAPYEFGWIPQVLLFLKTKLLPLVGL